MDVTCIIATLLFFISGALRVAEIRQQSRDHFDFEKWTDFDATYVKQEWEWREGQQLLNTASGLINTISWVVFAIPMLHVVWLSSQKGRSSVGLHAAVAVLAVAAALTELISQTITIGSFNTMYWIANEFQLVNWSGVDAGDALGWKTLEMVGLAVYGMLTWIDAFEFLFLSAMFLFLFVAVHAQPNPVFGRAWANYGMVLSVFAVVDFTCDILRFKDWLEFSSIAFVISGFSRVVLFPIWLIWLGVQIPAAQQKLKLAEEANAMAVTSPLIESTSISGIPNATAKTPKLTEHEFVGDPDPLL